MTFTRDMEDRALLAEYRQMQGSKSVDKERFERVESEVNRRGLA